MSVAYDWLDAIRKKTVKNMTHSEFIHKYADFRQNIDQLVLILTGLRWTHKEYFLIRIHGALYEPFNGPHLVQIGQDAPFWVHSLTAFRREFFGLTDKLSFERSVFVGLSDGVVIRLKIARPYLFMAHEVALQGGSRLKIMKTPTDSFWVTERDIMKHKRELQDKKAKAVETNQAVRTRVRNHLVGSVQQLFCSYMRDPHIAPDQAYMWFQTDVQFALEQCTRLYGNFARVRPTHDLADYEQRTASAGRPQLSASSAEVTSVLMSGSSRVDTTVCDLMREQRLRDRGVAAGAPVHGLDTPFDVSMLLMPPMIGASLILGLVEPIGAGAAGAPVAAPTASDLLMSGIAEDSNARLEAMEEEDAAYEEDEDEWALPRGDEPLRL
jgi:hypothetical protein